MKRIFITLTLVLFVIPFGISQTHGTSIDQNSNSFEWIKYGDQYWSVVNAEVETYRDGTPIPYVEDQTVWKDLTIGAWCYYDNDTTKGKLYNWYAIAGIHDNDENTPNKKFAPEGWYVPSDAEWTELETYLIESGYNYDQTTTENKIAKAMASITGWNNSPSDGVPGNNQALNNSSGFNAQANGFLEITGAFKHYGIGFNSWHGSEHTLDDAKYFRIANYDNFTESRITYKQEGLSVRFVSSNPSSILLNGVVSTENNQIKNVANPTDAQDAVNLGFLTEKLNELTQKINELESLIDSPQVQPPSEYALSFDANNYVRFPNIDSYDNLDSMTIEFWAYLNSSPCTDESIIGTEYFATGWHFYPGMWAMIGGPNNAEAISNVDAHGSCENYIESSKWFHIALQYNSELNENQWKLYIDGDLHEQKTGNISSIGDGGDIVINRHTWDSGSSSRLSGYIDEVRFSKIARYSGNFTPEIKQLQNDENTLLLLNFENTTSNQVIDSSTNQNHGIINGTVNYVLRNDIEDSNAAN